MSDDRVRIRHYTSRARSFRIEAEGMIRTGARGAIFCESALRPAKPPHDVEERYLLDRGRANAYVEVDIPIEWIEVEVNPLTGGAEWLVRRAIPLDSSVTLTRRA